MEVAPPRCRLRCKRASLGVSPPHRKLETFTNFVEGSSAGSTFAPVPPPSPAAPFAPLEALVPSPVSAHAVGALSRARTRGWGCHRRFVACKWTSFQFWCFGFIMEKIRLSHAGL